MEAVRWRCFSPKDTARCVQSLLGRPQLSLVGILIAWFAIGRLFSPVHLMAVRLLFPEFTLGS